MIYPIKKNILNKKTLMKSNKIKKINKFELQSIYILCSSCIIQIVFKEERDHC